MGRLAVRRLVSALAPWALPGTFRIGTTMLYKSASRWELAMETTLSKLRGNLKSFCDRSVANREAIRIRRRTGEDLVLLPAEEYDSLAETVHLLASPRNAARLLAALGRARKDKLEPLSVEDLRAALGI
jgi:antitoxin YefM